MDFAEFREWQWFMRELNKAKNGDTTAFTAAGEFDSDSLDAQLLARFAHFKPSR